MSNFTFSDNPVQSHKGLHAGVAARGIGDADITRAYG